MGEVLRALEGPIAPMICASDDPEHATSATARSRCTVNVLWVRVRDAIAGALDSMTLADLVPPTPRIPPPTPIQPTQPGSPDRPVTDQTPPPTSTSSSAACASRPPPSPTTRSSRGST